MAATSRADATWEGDLVNGSGHVKPASGAFGALPITWASRAERAAGKTSPEELIAAAHAACFSMAFSNGLAKAGHKVDKLETGAQVDFVPGTGITKIALSVRGRVHGIDAAEFSKLAEAAKEGCPVSKALQGNVEITDYHCGAESTCALPSPGFVDNWHLSAVPGTGRGEIVFDWQVSGNVTVNLIAGP